MVKKRKKQNKTATLPERFVPQFWNDCDGRIAVVKEIRRRVTHLKEDSQADSIQKTILCERAVFITCQLESQERIAIEKGVFDGGRYTQMVNCLIGLLRSIGLERRAKQITDLKTYVQSKRKRRN